MIVLYMFYSTYYVKKCNRNNTQINRKFVDWMNKIEMTVMSKTGLHLLDLLDEGYMINFESGFSPTEMVKIILAELELFLV